MALQEVGIKKQVHVRKAQWTRISARIRNPPVGVKLHEIESSETGCINDVSRHEESVAILLLRGKSGWLQLADRP